MRRALPYLLLLVCVPLALYLTTLLEPTSPALLKCAFGLTVTVEVAALLSLFARWTGRPELTSSHPQEAP
ncbi:MULTISPECIES: hypothetical protein [Deinococcus]|uniref:Secreted protein n=1 Tax=Deinococcus rufus TaxID=2136097 RepID=A0ABV7ZEF6_9DEIO|nr:hypothetical protein [Deinococcus sp. AB2017081]WQE94073.1 hypothetical protein U2P90_11700 [Deinococcus sp. AB2017081]